MKYKAHHRGLVSEVLGHVDTGEKTTLDALFDLVSPSFVDLVPETWGYFVRLVIANSSAHDGGFDAGKLGESSCGVFSNEQELDRLQYLRVDSVIALLQEFGTGPDQILEVDCGKLIAVLNNTEVCLVSLNNGNFVIVIGLVVSSML